MKGRFGLLLFIIAITIGTGFAATKVEMSLDMGSAPIEMVSSIGTQAPFDAGQKVALEDIGTGRGDYNITAEVKGFTTDADGTRAIVQWNVSSNDGSLNKTSGWSYPAVTIKTTKVPDKPPCGCAMG